MALERNQEHYPLEHGARAAVYTRPRNRKYFSCRVTFPDGTFATKLDSFGAISNALTWARHKVNEWKEGQG